METPEEAAKLQLFLQWLEINGAQLRGCKIKYCDSRKGFGIFSANDVPDGILLVVPLDLAITPMRVLQDPLYGPECGALSDEGPVDDRLLMLLFLTVERLRKNSPWKPEVSFSDFLWANSVFWTRAQNIPLSESYVHPEAQEKQVGTASCSRENGQSDNHVPTDGQNGKTVFIEGLVPGIDFCNHDSKPIAMWEVDGTGFATGVPCSMYLISAGQHSFKKDTEISISYGNKGNEELLYLYGFVMKNNPDDYLMVNYPMDAIQDVAFSEQKQQLLEAQKAEFRCLLPRSLLDNGFFPPSTTQGENNGNGVGAPVCSYSWSGHRKTPSYLNKLVFPDDFLTSLRTIAMKESELYQVASLLEELVGREGNTQPSESEVRAAVWEACGDSGALQILVDLLNMRLMDLEEGSGTEDHDIELLENAECAEAQEYCKRSETNIGHLLSRNRWSSIVYRLGQKQLTRLFLKEAEQALELALTEKN